MAGTVLSWSGGKDAAFALHELRSTGTDVAELLTTVSAETGRSTMHGVRTSLYEQQAAAVGVELRCVTLPPSPDNDTYESVMGDVVAEYVEQGVDRLAFADLYLEDVREYREDRLDGSGLESTFPLWGRSTDELATSFVDDGFRAVVVAGDGDRLDESLAGRQYDREFLADLPEGVDPCGENGEFHTFVYDGPIFDEPLSIDVGKTESRPVADGTFHYARLSLVDADRS